MKSVLREDYNLHIDDGLTGIQRMCEQLGVFRSSAVLAIRAPVQALSAKDHNVQILQSTFPKEAFTAVRFPAGTVLWWEDPVLSQCKAHVVSDASSMANEVLFRESAWESWYVNGRCRFWMRIFRHPKASRSESSLNSSVLPLSHAYTSRVDRFWVTFGSIFYRCLEI